MKYTSMAICETFTDDNVNEVVTRMQNHVQNLPELIGHSILTEEGGRMVILVTEWASREDCLKYHSSKTNRRFIADTQHMLVGSYVVKLFEKKSEKQ